MKLLKLLLLPLLLIQTALLWAEGANDEFPLRVQYPNVKTIGVAELSAKRHEVIVFDVRSAYEYDTLHIKEARHLPINGKAFTQTLQKLRATSEKAFIFYCNGHTCKKSYKAAKKAQFGRVGNVYAFDAGIFDWTRAYPSEAVLLGESPVDPGKLISKAKLTAHMLEPGAFALRVGDTAITLDIRDRLQRGGITLFPTRQRFVPLDNKKLERFVNKAKSQNKTLLIYDAVGKQVQWLQYYLESTGIKDYYFMRGGVKAFLEPR